jgi:myo-inositol-1(or 4)-monophosphatase
MRHMSEELTRVAVDAARLAGKMLRERFRDGSLRVRAKAKHDFVTEADHDSEALIIEAIQTRFPDHLILSEEVGLVGPQQSEFRWIIDPLDGTGNFLKGLPVWSVSIACRHQNRGFVAVVYDPIRNDLFSASRSKGAYLNGEPIHVSERIDLNDGFFATGFPFRARGALDIYLNIFRRVFLEARGIRRCGSAALDLAYTAAGVFDGFFEFRLSAWDIAAGDLLIREAGGVLSDLDGGQNYLESGNVVAAPENLQRKLLAAAQEYASEQLLDELAPVEEAIQID